MEVQVQGRVDGLPDPLMARALLLASSQSQVVGWDMIAPTGVRAFDGFRAYYEFVPKGGLTVKAIVRRLTGKPRRGASTISMRLTTLIDPEPQAYRTLANGGIWTPRRLTPGAPAPQNGRRV